MRQKLAAAILLVSSAYSVSAQTESISINGTIADFKNSANVTTVSLMQNNAIEPIQIQQTNVDANGEFHYTLPSNTLPGVYFIQSPTLYQKINVIVDGKERNIDFVYSPNASQGAAPLHFTNSEQNEDWNNYQVQSSKMLNQINNIENAAEATGMPEAQKLISQGVDIVKAEFRKEREAFIQKHDGTLAALLVKNDPHRLEYFNLIRELPTDVQQKYWDDIDTGLPVLTNTSLYKDLIYNYLMYYLAETSKKEDRMSVENQKQMKSNLMDGIDIVMSRFNKDEYIQTYAIRTMQSIFMDLAQTELVQYVTETYANQCAQCTDNPQTAAGSAAEHLKKMTEGFKVTAIGMPAPEMQIPENGAVLSLKDLPEKKVVIVFWNTSCGYCEQQMPIAEKYLADKKDKDLAVVDVCLSQDKEKYENLVKQYPHMRHVLDGGGWQGKLVNAYYVNGTPTFFILDKNRNFAGTANSWAAVLDLIEPKK